MRLHMKIWLAVMASLLALAMVGAGAWRLGPGADRDTGSAATLAWLADDLLPVAASPTEWRTTLERWRERTGASLSLVAPDGRMLAAAGERAAAPPADVPAPGATLARWRAGPTQTWFVVRLGDGRRLLADASRFGRFSGGVGGLLLTLGAVALVIGLGTLPVVRRLTRRLTRLQLAVEALGEGELSSRVPVHGRDEVARLARSFNDAADRIEALVQAQKRLLANASHELRSPLARIRMAVEMLEGAQREDARDEVVRSVAELDALVEELLLASRLDAQSAAQPLQRDWRAIDLAGLVAECCAPYRVDLEAGMVRVQGNDRLLRRLVRNLVENALRHGIGSTQAPEVSLTDDSGVALLRVCDRGPGVPEDERERIFEPFHRARGASERDGGVGLGLSLVRQIARHHRGTVRCIAREGGGSCFEFRMPAER